VTRSREAPGKRRIARSNRSSASAGLTPQLVEDVDVTWQFEDLDTALAAMLSAGPSILAIQTSGRDRVRATLERAIAPFRLSNGRYRLENRFRYLVAARD
jgi:hypothetical protein